MGAYSPISWAPFGGGADVLARKDADRGSPSGLGRHRLAAVYGSWNLAMALGTS